MEKFTWKYTIKSGGEKKIERKLNCRKMFVVIVLSLYILKDKAWKTPKHKELCFSGISFFFLEEVTWGDAL